MRHLLTLVSAFLFGALVNGAEVSGERFSDQQKAASMAQNDSVAPLSRSDLETEPADAVIATGAFPLAVAIERKANSYPDLALSSLAYDLPQARAPPAYL